MSRRISFSGALFKAISNMDASLLFNIVFEQLNQSTSPAVNDFVNALQMISSIHIVKSSGNNRNSIQSAALIRRDSTYYLCFNKGFVERYIKTGDDLTHLVLHELGHKIRGDLRRSISTGKSIPKNLVNIVADMLNDAMLRRIFFKEPPGYLRELYDVKEFYQLLAPPEILVNLPYSAVSTMERKTLIEKIEMRFGEGNRMAKKDIAQIAELYCNAWLDDVSFDSTLNILVSILNKYSDIYNSMEDIVLFLGNHDFGNYSDDLWDSWFFQTLSDKIIGKEGGRGLSEEEEQISYITSRKRSEQIQESIKQAIEKGNSASMVQQQCLIPEIGVFPYIRRKEAFLLKGGFTPIFYRNPSMQRNPVESRINMYIDVSGSVNGLLPFLYGLIVKLSDMISEPIYLFSNKVVPVSMDEIKKGIVRTTKGTDFDCVAEHTLNHQFKKIIVITDGFAKFQIFKEKLMSKCEVYVVLTGTYIHSEIIEVAGGYDKENTKWWKLRDEKKYL